MSTGGRRRRGLTEEERQLWQKVADSVEPIVRIRRRRRASIVEASPAEPDPVPVPPPPAEPPPTPAHRPHPAHPPRAKHHVKPAPTPLAPIDARTKRKIVRGSVPLEERIDLHGLTQADAYRALRAFIAGARVRGVKMVLVITGKGHRPGSGDPGHDVFTLGERGVLRRLVPQWLSLPDMRDYVVGFEEAHLAHGGAGAIYVRLRALKPRRPGDHSGRIDL